MIIEAFNEFIQILRQAIIDFGQIGLFVYSIIETITPLAGVEILFAILLANGSSWWQIALNASIANCVGAAIIYYFFAKEDNRLYNKIVKPKHQVKAKRLFDLYGVWAIFIFAMTPLPFFVIIFTASMARMNFRLYTLVVLISRGARFFLTTYIFHQFTDVGTGTLVLVLTVIAVPLTIVLFFIQKLIMRYLDKKVAEQEEAEKLQESPSMN